jgi:hypothetical protein
MAPASVVDHAMMDLVPIDEAYTVAAFVAGHRWVPPAQEWTQRMPPSVVTVSDCLADFEPPDQDPLTAPWHASLEDARGAAGFTTAQPLAMSVPSPTAQDLAMLVEQWIGDVPHPILVNLASALPPPTGTALGFEVLGFESGRFHTWLCYGLIDNAVQNLAIPAASQRCPWLGDPPERTATRHGQTNS